MHNNSKILFSLFDVGLNLSQTFIAFIILTAIQFIALLSVKVSKATDFKQNRQKFSKFTYLVEQLNATSVYKDWDDGEDTIEGRKKRYEDCHWEMIWSLAIRRAFKLISIHNEISLFKAQSKAICLKCRNFK